MQGEVEVVEKEARCEDVAAITADASCICENSGKQGRTERDSVRWSAGAQCSQLPISLKRPPYFAVSSSSPPPDSCPHNNGSDYGYSSSMESSEMGSREGSDVACSEGICNHDEAGEWPEAPHWKTQCSRLFYSRHAQITLRACFFFNMSTFACCRRRPAGGRLRRRQGGGGRGRQLRGLVAPPGGKSPRQE